MNKPTTPKRSAMWLIEKEVEKTKEQLTQPQNQQTEDQNWLRGRISGLRDAQRILDQLG